MVEELIERLEPSNHNLNEQEIRVALKILGCKWKIKNLVKEFIILPEKNVLQNISKQLNF